MSSPIAQLEQNLTQRRARAAQATQVVAALATASAEDIATQVALWLTQAYSLTPVSVESPSHGMALRVLERDSQRLILAATAGDAIMNWQQLDKAFWLTLDLPADQVILVTLQSIDEDLTREAQDKGVKLWGRAQLEIVYREIEHEVGGLTLF
jgi:hypothetical protein